MNEAVCGQEEDSARRRLSLNLSLFLVPGGAGDPVVRAVSDRFYGPSDPSSIVSMVSLTSYQTRGYIHNVAMTFIISLHSRLLYCNTLIS